MSRFLFALASLIIGVTACGIGKQNAVDLAHILGYTQDCGGVCWLQLVPGDTTEERLLSDLGAVKSGAIAVQQWRVNDGSHWYQWHFNNQYNRITYVTRFENSILTRTYIEDLQTDLASLSKVIGLPSHFLVEDSGIPEKPGYHYAFYFPSQLIEASGFVSREHACSIKNTGELEISIITRSELADTGKYDRAYSQLENELPVECIR